MMHPTVQATHGNGPRMQLDAVLTFFTLDEHLGKHECKNTIY